MTINKRDLLALGLATAAAPALTLAQSKPAAKAAAAASEDIVLGASMPLTGVFAFAGIAIDAGIKDYLSILNEGGGVKGRKVKYVVEDTGYKVDQSMAVYKRITSGNKVNLYYADSTGFCKAVNPELERNGNILMTGASFAKEISDAGKYPLQFMGTFWTMDNSTVMKMGPNADGFMGVMPYRYHYDTEGRSPMLERIRKMRPEYQATGYMQGFLAAMLLTEAARRTLDAGNELTGKNMKIALSSIRNFDTGGIIGVPLSIKGNSIPIGRVYKADFKAQKMLPASDWIDLSKG